MLDQTSAAELEVQADQWAEEANRLERDEPQLTLEEELGDVLITRNIVIKDLLSTWDHSGDGTINKGELRLNMRALNLKVLDNEGWGSKVDALFDEWDEDKQGSVEIKELKVNLVRLVHLAKKRLEKAGPKREQIATLRRRAAAAREAAKATAEADILEKEVEELKAALNATVEVRLGKLLNTRKVKVGDVVGTWATSRGKHSNEISRGDFRQQMLVFGFEVRGLHGWKGWADAGVVAQRT